MDQRRAAQVYQRCYLLGCLNRTWFELEYTQGLQPGKYADQQ